MKHRLYLTAFYTKTKKVNVKTLLPAKSILLIIPGMTIRNGGNNFKKPANRVAP